jgi:hypothetical protein
MAPTLAPTLDIHTMRRLLLPGWIRFFSWLFMLCWLVPVVALVFALVSPESFKTSLFGLSYAGHPLALPALAIEGFLLFMGVTAYGLLWGRAWGLHAGLIVGVVGLVLSVSMMVAGGFTTIRLEPLLQVPFIVALMRRRKAWAEGLAPVSPSAG